jgi:hypothetical protein
MAYQVKDLKILPGGLNLLPPGDQINEGDCLDLTDWWPGCAGKLEQAPQAVNLTGALEMAWGHDSLLQADGRIYSGGYGNLSQIGRGLVDSGYDGYPLGMISMSGFAWIMNRAKQRRDDGTSCSDWFIGAPNIGPLLTALPGVGGLSPNTPYQEYEYYLTFIIAGLGETNPSPPTPLTVNQGDAIIANRGPSVVPTGATGWNLYRQNYVDTGGIPLFGTVYLLNAAPIPMAQTVYIDYGDAVHQQDDTSLLQLGVIMEMNHDAPPAARVTANQIFNGRIVVANSADHPNRVFYTNALQPAYFPGANDPNMGNWVDIGTDKGDEILAIAVRPKTLIIYRRRSIWRQLGDFDDPTARIEVIVPEFGIAGPRAMVSTSQGDYFVASANRGFYSFNNDWAAKASDQVDPIFRGLPTENFPQLASAYDERVAVGYRGGRVWISYPNLGGTMVAALIYHVASGRWFAGSYGGADGYGAFLDAGEQFLGNSSGAIVSLESAYQSSNTHVAFQSLYLDAGLPDHEKTWADLVVNHNLQGTTLTVTIKCNKGADVFDLAVLSSNVMTKQIIPMVYPSNYATVALRGLPIQSYNLSVRISGGGADDAPILIDGPIILHYYLEARRAKTFDTAPGDQGSALVKIADQVEFSIDASDGAGTMQIYTDLPGGVLTARLSPPVVIPMTIGRQAERIVLPAPLAGKLMRLTAQTPTDFRIYGVRARILPIGVYIDGTIGDFWQPEPISIGV